MVSDPKDKAESILKGSLTSSSCLLHYLLTWCCGLDMKYSLLTVYVLGAWLLARLEGKQLDHGVSGLINTFIC